MQGSARCGKPVERGSVSAIRRYHRRMADAYRRHSVVEAPIEDVWAIVSDPDTHSDWWPEVQEVRTSGALAEGDEYTRVSRRLGFLDLVDAVWVVERLDHLKEAHFRCTMTGTYTRFALTPAQDATFVEVEAGTVPTGLQGRVVKAAGRLWFRRWLDDLLDALPVVVARRSRSHQGSSS